MCVMMVFPPHCYDVGHASLWLLAKQQKTTITSYFLFSTRVEGGQNNPAKIGSQELNLNTNNQRTVLYSRTDR